MDKLILCSLLFCTIVSSKLVHSRNENKKQSCSTEMNVWNGNNMKGVLLFGFEWYFNSHGFTWTGKFGSEYIGVEFGVITCNNAGIKTSLPSRHLQLDFHNEVYAQVNVLGFKIHVSFALLCYKGQFNLNIQELGAEQVGIRVTDGITSLVNTIYSDLFSSENIFAFYKEFRSHPDKVFNLGRTIKKAMKDYVNKLPDILLDPWKMYVYKLIRDTTIDWNSDGLYLHIGGKCANSCYSGNCVKSVQEHSTLH